MRGRGEALLEEPTTRPSAKANRKRSSDRWARVLGVVIGLALAGVIVFMGRVAPLGANPAASVTLQPVPTGELGIETAAPLVESRDLRPGPEATAVAAITTVHNQTGKDKRVRVRLVPSTGDLDGMLQVEVVLAGRLMARGGLGELRRWSEREAVLQSGQGRTLSVRAWLPESVEDRYQGLASDIRLDFKAASARAKVGPTRKSRRPSGKSRTKRARD